ncbi:protein-methionine sulfoxide oxidase mical2b isoform X1 [Takifugu flavidus]|uniref:protein-methionine sulfoxide oxidase mical2b isoform X1 n=1 Tax=Takifugu flavidus TaxID=433684 RepID=UPI0025440498|nr:protein-methionine sulfoxide oxidase mical2b isoform X1 [Takifugu flavidus]
MSAVKALQQWCRVQVQGYRDVSITNMTTSFRDGLAFCALIHKHRPDLINFDSLKKENVYENNKLAFGVAEEELGIPALLDAEDMVALQIPDRLSILTYVSQYYNYFHGRSPIGGMGGIKRPAEGPAEEPSGKKNQPMVSKVFPSYQPTRENSPPPSSNTSRPPPSPKYPRNAKQDVVVEKSNQTGTLSNKCISCNKRVHLVERHLVDGKLYHRSCAKSLAPITNCPPLRDLPTNTSVSKPTPPRDPSKTSIDISSRLGPTWQKDKASTPPSFSSTLSTPSPPPSRPVSALSSAAKDSRTALTSKPVTSQAPSGPTFTTTASAAAAATRPTPAPRTSTTVAKTLQSKIQFFQSDDSVNNEKKATNTDTKKAGSGTGAVQHVTAGEAVTITVNIGKKDLSLNSAEDKSKASGVGSGSGNGSESSKAKAAAFISRKLAEENNNNKPPRTNVALKKTDKPSQVETPKREKEAVRGRVKLKVDPSLLADLQTPEESRPVPVPRRPRSRTPDPGPTNPSSILPNTSAEHESPADWRSKLKPISKQTKALGPSPPSPKLSANGPGKSQTSGPAQPQEPSPSISITPPAPKGSLNGQQDLTRPDAEAKVSKKKPDYIPKEDILKELQEIDDNLTKLEKEGVQLEMRLRRCEEDGEDDSFMDELMVEWFNLIRNKQVAMRRESELVYIGKTQELEEQQPSVEQELRRLMETPEHLKSSWHNEREKELMTKLMEIVNDRNAIVEGLDDDRLREEEEDEQLNRMMKDFNIKKEKPKKKSPMSKLFGWGGKKETP